MFNLVSVLLKDDIHGYHPMLYLSALDLLFFGGNPLKGGCPWMSSWPWLLSFFWGDVGMKSCLFPDVHVVSNEPYILLALLNNQTIHVTWGGLGFWFHCSKVGPQAQFVNGVKWRPPKNGRKYMGNLDLGGFLIGMLKPSIWQCRDFAFVASAWRIYG